MHPFGTLLCGILLAVVGRGEDWPDYGVSVLPDIDPPDYPVDTPPEGRPPPAAFDFLAGRPGCEPEAPARGNCASGWALAPAALVALRSCSRKASAQRLLTCCRACGAGCWGGYHWKALEFLRLRGTPSSSCHPYRVPPGPSKLLRYVTPPCFYARKCAVPGVVFAETGIKKIYSVKDIEREIFARGPVLSYVRVYPDLLRHSEGVYEGGGHRSGGPKTREAVLLIGWGVEGGVPYWSVLTFWPSTSRSGNSAIKILRGNNTNDIEKHVVAVLV